MPSLLELPLLRLVAIILVTHSGAAYSFLHPSVGALTSRNLRAGAPIPPPRTGRCSVAFLRNQRAEGGPGKVSMTSGAASGREEMTVDDWFKKNGTRASSQSLGGSSWAQNYK